jgi:hypothetical protein
MLEMTEKGNVGHIESHLKLDPLNSDARFGVVVGPDDVGLEIRFIQAERAVFGGDCEISFPSMAGAIIALSTPQALIGRQHERMGYK